MSPVFIIVRDFVLAALAVVGMRYAVKGKHGDQMGHLYCPICRNRPGKCRCE